MIRPVAFGAATLAALCGAPAPAGAADGWTAKVVLTEPPFDPERKKLVPAEYSALGTGEVGRKWHICLLLAHTGSEYWVGYTYGAVEEVKRHKAKLTVLSAGGYANVAGQIGQLEDCVTQGANAAIIVTTSPAGLNNAINEARKTGVAIVDAANGVSTEVDARVVVSYQRVGFAAGRYVAGKHPAGSGKVKLLYLAGPPGATYVELQRKGFYEGIAESDIQVVKDMYAPSNKAAQLKLVEDGLQTYPEISYIVGGAPGVEAAIDALRERGRKDIRLISTFQTPVVWSAVEAGNAAGVLTDFAVLQARMGVDLALRILEKKPHMKDVAPESVMIDPTNVKTVERASSLLPPGWQMTYKVD